MSIASLNDLTRSLEADFWRLKQQQQRFDKDLERSAIKAKLRHHRETGGRTSEDALFPSYSLRERLRQYNLSQRYKNPNVEKLLQKYHGQYLEPLHCDDVKAYSQYYHDVAQGRSTTLEATRDKLKAATKAQLKVKQAIQLHNHGQHSSDDSHPNGDGEHNGNDDYDGYATYSHDEFKGRNPYPTTRSTKSKTTKTCRGNLSRSSGTALPPSNVAESNLDVSVDLLRRLSLFPAKPKPARQINTLRAKEQVNTESSAPVAYAYRIPKGSFQTLKEERVLNAESLGVLRPSKPLQDSRTHINQTTESRLSIMELSLNSLTSNTLHASTAAAAENSKSELSSTSMYDASPPPTLYPLTAVYPRAPLPRRPVGYSLQFEEEPKRL